MKWLFLALVIANLLPRWFATNDSADELRPRSASTAQSGPGSSDNILLLAELGGDRVRSGSEKPQTTALPQRRDQFCFLIGPLASLSVAESFAQKLEARDFPLQRHWREVEAGVDYWVHLAPQPSARATTRLLQELKANAIDSFLIPEGELEGGIALGVYTDQGEAEDQAEDYRALGYEPQIQALRRLAREYWLTSDQAPEEGLLASVAKNNDLAAIPQKISRKGCKTVASAMQFQ